METNNTLPTRKKNRLEQFDYSRCGAYFITVCTKNKRNSFWEDVGAIIDRPEAVPLSVYGHIVKQTLEAIPSIYPAVSVDRYVIMPNHIHLLLTIHADEGGRPMVAPTIAVDNGGRPMVAPTTAVDDGGRPMVAPTIAHIVKQWKGVVSKHVGFSIWQKSFYDHIIRNTQDYEQHAKYIEENPIRWCDDELYI